MICTQVPASDILATGQPLDDPEKMEHFVPVEWAKTVQKTTPSTIGLARQPQHGLRAQNPEVADNY